MFKLRGRGLSGLRDALSAIGACWLVSEILTKLFESVELLYKANGQVVFCMLLGCAIVTFLKSIYRPTATTLAISAATKLQIKFGDILDQDTDILIGVNDFFDHEIGDIVSKNSIHGQFILKFFHGNAQTFRKQVDRALPTQTAQTVHRELGQTSRYKIGTTAVLRLGAQNAYLVAIAQTDPTTHKARSDPAMLWTAIRSALETIYVSGNGASVSIPLIGTGQSSTNIEPQQILRFLVLALVMFGRSKALPANVQIILPKILVTQLDIDEIRRDWSFRK